MPSDQLNAPADDSVFPALPVAPALALIARLKEIRYPSEAQKPALLDAFNAAAARIRQAKTLEQDARNAVESVMEDTGLPPAVRAGAAHLLGEMGARTQNETSFIGKLTQTLNNEHWPEVKTALIEARGVLVESQLRKLSDQTAELKATSPKARSLSL